MVFPEPFEVGIFWRPRMMNTVMRHIVGQVTQRKPGKKPPYQFTKNCVKEQKHIAQLSVDSKSPASPADLYHSGTDGVRHETGTVPVPETRLPEKSEKRNGAVGIQMQSRK